MNLDDPIGNLHNLYKKYSRWATYPIHCPKKLAKSRNKNSSWHGWYGCSGICLAFLHLAQHRDNLSFDVEIQIIFWMVYFLKCCLSFIFYIFPHLDCVIAIIWKKLWSFSFYFGDSVFWSCEENISKFVLVSLSLCSHLPDCRKGILHVNALGLDQIFVGDFDTLKFLFNHPEIHKGVSK